MNTPAISVMVVMKERTLRLDPISFCQITRRIAPVVAAKVVIDIKLIPTAKAIKGPSPCHQAREYY